MRLSAPIHRLKSTAKKRAREAGIPLNQALDDIAKQEGFQSWSHLSASNAKASGPPYVTEGKPTISSLPITGPDRAEFIELANHTFERVLDRIEADNPEATRALWDAEDYIDNQLLSPDMLTIDRDYALSLIEAFMVHHVIPLATQADEAATA